MGAIRFTLRDLLWLTAIVAVAIAWWMEQRKVAAVMQERDEAVALWHDAAAKWVAATSRIRPDSETSEGSGGGGSTSVNPDAGVIVGGLGGAILTPPTPANRPRTAQ